MVINERGARRWERGHPWVYRSDLLEPPPNGDPGIVRVLDPSGQALGPALYSPASEIRIRFLDRGAVEIDRAWWTRRIEAAVERRRGIDATAFRLVHAEADGLPSLIVDRYGPYVAVQLLSAGLEAVREDVLEAIGGVAAPAGIVLRNDVPVREHEDLPREVETLGDVPESVEVVTGAVRMRVDLRAGQKTGSFLDQRENHALAGRVARGRGLDAFCYEGGFALHMASGCDEVIAVDQSARALARVRENAALNGLDGVRTLEANAFDVLGDRERAGERFDTVVLDPPAFAKSRRSVTRALSGYKEINLRAMRLLSPGGHLLSFSCSYHVSRAAFEEMLVDAAGDSGRRIARVEWLGAAPDHPAVLSIPESSYLKGAWMTALE